MIFKITVLTITAILYHLDNKVQAVSMANKVPNNKVVEAAHTVPKLDRIKIINLVHKEMMTTVIIMIIEFNVFSLSLTISMTITVAIKLEASAIQTDPVDWIITRVILKWKDLLVKRDNQTRETTRWTVRIRINTYSTPMKVYTLLMTWKSITMKSALLISMYSIRDMKKTTLRFSWTSRCSSNRIFRTFLVSTHSLKQDLAQIRIRLTMITKIQWWEALTLMHQWVFNHRLWRQIQDLYISLRRTRKLTTYNTDRIISWAHRIKLVTTTTIDRIHQTDRMVLMNQINLVKPIHSFDQQWTTIITTEAMLDYVRMVHQIVQAIQTSNTRFLSKIKAKSETLKRSTCRDSKDSLRTWAREENNLLEEDLRDKIQAA